MAISEKFTNILQTLIPKYLLRYQPLTSIGYLKKIQNLIQMY